VPDLYQSGEFIPELLGSIQGGITIVCHEPDELTTLDAICAIAAGSNEPLQVVHGLMNSPNLSPDIWHFGRTAKEYPHWRDLSEAEELSDIRQLRGICSMTRELWERDSDPRLAALVTIGQPGNGATAPIEIAGESPGLVFHKGSLLATLMTAPMKVKGYSVALIGRRGISPSQRAERILEDMRRRAEATPGVEKLDRLEDLTENRLRNKQGLVVFLHGLLSTDVGVFDGLIRLLNDDPELSGRCVLAGWPHDSLAPIDSNALELRRWIEKIVPFDGPAVTFVCHSRGGLVGRRTAVKLYGRSRRWLEKVCGCVTFGTPHEGCPLAEQPRQMIGKAATVLAASQTRSWWSISDMLAIAKGRTSLPGVEDLRPINGGGDFLKDLLESEAKYAPEDRERALDVLAVGGDAYNGGLLSRISLNAFAGQDNDLIVETRSSIPKLFPNCYRTRCDHFSYFNESEIARPHFAEVVSFLKLRMLSPAESRTSPGGRTRWIQPNVRPDR
jgi:hypothetical protein